MLGRFTIRQRLLFLIMVSFMGTIIPFLDNNMKLSEFLKAENIYNFFFIGLTGFIIGFASSIRMKIEGVKRDLHEDKNVLERIYSQIPIRNAFEYGISGILIGFNGLIMGVFLGRFSAFSFGGVFAGVGSLVAVYLIIRKKIYF